MDVDAIDTNKTLSPQGQRLDEMTVIDEVSDEAEKKDSSSDAKQDNVSQGSFLFFYYIKLSF